jgi:hypothetical protein
MSVTTTALRKNDIASTKKTAKIVYPSLNVYFSPRVYKDRIDHKNLPLCAYTQKI